MAHVPKGFPADGGGHAVAEAQRQSGQDEADVGAPRDVV